MARDSKYDTFEKPERSLNPVIMLINALIFGVMVLMAFLTYRYITSVEAPEPPPRAIPAIAEVEEVDELEIEVEPEIPEIPETPPPVITKAQTPPPQPINNEQGIMNNE